MEKETDLTKGLYDRMKNPLNELFINPPPVTKDEREYMEFIKENEPIDLLETVALKNAMEQAATVLMNHYLAALSAYEETDSRIDIDIARDEFINSVGFMLGCFEPAKEVPDEGNE